MNFHIKCVTVHSLTGIPNPLFIFIYIIMFEKNLLIYRYRNYKTIRKLFLVFQSWKVTVALTTLCILTSVTMNIVDLTGLYSVWSYKILKKRVMVKSNILMVYNSKFFIFSFKIKTHLLHPD